MKMRWLLAAPAVLAACSGRGGIPDEPLPWISPAPAAPAAAAAVDLADGLDVEEAVALALEGNPRVQVSRMDADRARARKITAETPPHNPEIEVETGRALPFTKPEDFAARLSFSQTFEIAGQRRRRIAAAEADIERSLSGAADDDRRLRAEVAGQFYELVFLQQSEAIAAQGLENAKGFLEAAEARFRAGQIPEVEVNVVRLDHGRAEAEREHAAREAQVARARLAALMGRPDRSDFTLNGGLGAIVVIPDRERLLAVALERRSDLRAARTQVRAAEERLRLARAEAVTDLEVGVFAEREVSRIGEGDAALSDRDNVVGVGLRFALPVRNTRRGEILEAEIERRQAVLGEQAADQDVRRDVLTSVARLESARAVVESFEGRLNKLAQQNADDTARAYQAGEVGTLQVLQAQDDLNRAKASYAEAQLALRLALVEIEAAVGAPLTDVK